MAHGKLPHVPTGTTFGDRRSLYDAGVHRDIRRGICGSAVAGRGVESIVLSGGYEDDIDLGSIIYYTGQGTRDRRSRKLIADQRFEGLNKSLARSIETSEPVRVIRATARGFSYDGLYVVEDAWQTQGVDGYLICRYRLRDCPETSTSLGWAGASPGDRGMSAARMQVTHFRMVRDGDVPAEVKRLYEYRCQICGIQIPTAGGLYAEGAHIVPLGFGEEGVDHLSNVLCLCPNHHVMLDHGAISLSDDWTVITRTGTVVGSLTIHAKHGLDQAHAATHRHIMGFSVHDAAASSEPIS